MVPAAACAFGTVARPTGIVISLSVPTERLEGPSSDTKLVL